MSLLEVQQLSVKFGSAIAAEDVSFHINAGEKFALVGESGSGKTVSALSILRLNSEASYSGRIVFNGEDILQKSEKALRQLRGTAVSVIFQEPMTALNPLFTIGNQIAEVLMQHEGLSAKAAARRTVHLLEKTGIADPARRAMALPHQLSGGQRQRAMIAMALACRPQLLIADEPTTALDVTIKVQILELLHQLQREENMAVLLISHDLNLVRHFADRVGVMAQGKLIETAATAALFAAPQQAYTSKLLASQPQRMTDEVDPDAPLLLRGDNLRCTFSLQQGWLRKKTFAAVDGVDLQLRKGETLGIVGESGSGKTTLGMALLRLSAATVEGSIRFDGRDLGALRSGAMRSLRSRMQVVFQDPYASLSPRRTIRQIVGEGLALHQPHLSPAQHRAEVVAALAEVGLSADTLDRYPHEFSGGQRQRIAIARAVVLKPELLLLDEPTSALDVTVQQQVLQLLAQLQKKHGLAYLLISHDLAVIRAMAHHILVMKDGKIVDSGSAQDVLQNPRHAYTRQLLTAATYGSAPLTEPMAPSR